MPSPLSSALFLARIFPDGAANLPAVEAYTPNADGRGDFARRVGPATDGEGDAVTPKAEGRPKTDLGVADVPTVEGAPNTGVAETDGNGVVLVSLASSWEGSVSLDGDLNTLGVSDCFGVVNGEKLGNGDLNLGALPPPNIVLGRVPPPNGAFSDLTSANGDAADANLENPPYNMFRINISAEFLYSPTRMRLGPGALTEVWY